MGKPLADFFFAFYIYSMLKQIIKGYSHLLSSILKILVLAALCAATGAVFVWPLWYFATAFPKTYTLCFLLLIFSVLAVRVVLEIKKCGFWKIFSFSAKLLVIALSFSAFVFLVLAGKRLFAFIEIPFALFIYGLVSFLLKQKKVKTENDF